MKCATVKGLSHISLCWKMPTVIIGQMRWGRIMVTSPTCLLAGKDMECQKYRDKYCGNCVKHHTYKETAVELQHFKTNHSPTTRSISEATAQDTHHRHHSARQPAIPHAHFHKHPLTIEMKVFFSRRLEAKQAVPHVDTCFRKHPLNTNSRRITAFQNQPFPNFFFFYTLLRPVRARSQCSCKLRARFPKHLLKTRSIGIYRHHSARQPAIPHAHARFHRHTLTIEMKCFCLTKT